MPSMLVKRAAWRRARWSCGATSLVPCRASSTSLSIPDRAHDRELLDTSTIGLRLLSQVVATIIAAGAKRDCSQAARDLETRACSTFGLSFKIRRPHVQVPFTRDEMELWSEPSFDPARLIPGCATLVTFPGPGHASIDRLVDSLTQPLPWTSECTTEPAA